MIVGRAVGLEGDVAGGLELHGRRARRRAVRRTRRATDAAAEGVSDRTKPCFRAVGGVVQPKREPPTGYEVCVYVCVCMSVVGTVTS